MVLYAAALALCAGAAPARPVLYSQAAHSSPVSAGPDDLLLLAGSGLTRIDAVVYRAVKTASAGESPEAVPATSTAMTGIAPVVSQAMSPDAVVVRMPPQLLAHHPYALWAHSAQGEWSNAVLINDPRPMWFTPGQVFATQRTAGLPRRLKIVGRNLWSRADVPAHLRLSGAVSVQLETRAQPVTDDDQVLEFLLPARLPAGHYRVALKRHDGEWTEVRGQTLEVRADPPPASVFAISAAEAGACHPDDALDDTACVRRAIAAAARHGGTVRFSAGTWLLAASEAETGGAGLAVPAGVNLEGAGAARTLLTRSSGPRGGAWFTLLGENTVRGILFEEHGAVAPDRAPAPVLALGPQPPSKTGGAAVALDHIVIADNIFDRAHPAISGSVPLRHLVIAGNEFGAYDFGLIIRGDRFDTRSRFQLEDSIIIGNTLMPGGYLDVPIRQGAIASQLGAAHRMDFSGNVARGASSKHLHDAEADGWRAAFFWSLSGAAEQLLISGNEISCSGDKDGDGEAIALDNDGNTFAYGEARDVSAATDDGIQIDGLPRTQQAGVAVPADYYVGHWVQIVAGAGIGQTRRITAYRADPASGRLIARIEPRWDVTPDASSRVIVQRQFWQVSISGNHVDNRRPLCRKSNRSAPKAGAISLWASVADSRVSHNEQFDSDGILLNQNYNAEDHDCPRCDAGASTLSFVDVHANSIDGEYDWASDCSHSGISLANSAAAVRGSRPPTVSFGVTVAHNRVAHADGLRGGAIGVALTWLQGPAPHDWPLVKGLLIHHNEISNLSGAAPRPQCTDRQLGRIGINLNLAGMVHDSVLYANACRDVSTPLHDDGRRTLRVCPGASPFSCECSVLSK